MAEMALPVLHGIPCGLVPPRDRGGASMQLARPLAEFGKGSPLRTAGDTQHFC